MKCTQCGAEISAGDKFCQVCGAKVSQDTANSSQNGNFNAGPDYAPPYYRSIYYDDPAPDNRVADNCGLFKAFAHVFKNYANFHGRARRREFWFFVLVDAIFAAVFLVAFSAAMVSLANQMPYLQHSFGYMTTYDDFTPVLQVIGYMGTFSVVFFVYYIYILMSTLPRLALRVKRLHDLDKSGWFVLLRMIPIVGFIILLVWYCSDGTVGPNKYGPDTKNRL